MVKKHFITATWQVRAKTDAQPNYRHLNITQKKKIIIQRANEHAHPEVIRTMVPEVREKIREYVKLGMKQRAISNAIRKNANFGIKPTKNQVSQIFVT